MLCVLVEYDVYKEFVQICGLVYFYMPYLLSGLRISRAIHSRVVNNTLYSTAAIGLPYLCCCAVGEQVS